jgi:NADH-quinone oxidoreductase subunit N
MTLYLLSLAGVPPTAGFMAKFFVFSAGIQAHENALVIIAVLSTVVAAFFYIRVIVMMWLQQPSDGGPAIGLGASPAISGALCLAAAGVIAFGVWPEALMHLARSAAVFTG